VSDTRGPFRRSLDFRHGPRLSLTLGRGDGLRYGVTGTV
jgi:hypothetical protein